MLRTRRFGRGEPLVALHGFTLTGDQFAVLADQLDREIVAPDLPGHGGSANLSCSVDDVVETVCTLTASFPSPVPLLGYSQGARIALLSALRCPDSVECLVLVSGNAGIDDDQLRRNRATQDDALAARIEMVGVERFIDDWTGAGLTSTEGMEPSDRARDRQSRLENTSEGLAAALRGYGQAAQPVVWSELSALDLPVLVIAGARDPAYTEIAERLADRIRQASLFIVSGSGHNPLVDEPDITRSEISAFLERNCRA